MNRSSPWVWLIFLAFSIGCLALGGWLRAVAAPEWTALDTTQHPPAVRPWAVEADCYSQLARVQRILRGGALIQCHFKIENWPEGLVPSTTAPFDYAILLLVAPLALVTRHPLDWAGALTSPALWIALGVFWITFRTREFTLSGRAVLLLATATLPGIIWATACGRPRHQSLILALMAIALTAEYERWSIELAPKRAWNIAAGLTWGLACWTSLFEPLVAFTFLVVFNLIMRRRENTAFVISFGTVMFVALLLEGVHIFVPPPQYSEALVRWLTTIAEVQPLGFIGLVHAMTLIVLVLPLLAWSVWPRQGGNMADAFLILLTFLLCLLAMLQARWLYYASLGSVLLLARFVQKAPLHWTRVVVIMFFIAGASVGDLEQITGRAAARPNQPSLELCQLAQDMDSSGGIMAPWWLSPGLLYFSGQPIVSGSSHCGISGIVASARFFASPSWRDAEHILRDRQVRWVVVWDDQRYVYPLLNSSRQILGQRAYSDDDAAAAEATVTQVLAEDRGDVPTFLHLRGVTDHLKLYEYQPGSR